MRLKLSSIQPDKLSNPLRASVYIVPGILMMIGTALMLAAAISYFNAADLVRHAQKTMGSVSDLRTIKHQDSQGRDQTRYQAVVSYQAAGRSYEITAATKYPLGAQVELVYDQHNPAQARINSINGIYQTALILLILGLLAEAVAIVVLIKTLRRHQIITWLFKNGTTLRAQVIEVNCRERLRRGNRCGTAGCSYQVVARYLDPASAKEAQFESESLNGDPGSELIGQEVEVLVNPNDWGTYFMHLRSIPNR